MDLLSTRNRRLLSGIQIPMHSEALLSQIKDTVAFSKHIPFDSAHLFESFFELIEKYPLLCGLLSELDPRYAALFWETYGDWLLHMVNHPAPSLYSPRIGPAAHRLDVHALKFVTHHLWPSSFWRDVHCYRCFFKAISARPLRLRHTHCDKHSCQSWALQLLQNLREQRPGFTAKSLLPTRQRSTSVSHKRRSTSSGKRDKAQRSTRKRSPSRRKRNTTANLSESVRVTNEGAEKNIISGGSTRTKKNSGGGAEGGTMGAEEIRKEAESRSQRRQESFGAEFSFPDRSHREKDNIDTVVPFAPPPDLENITSV